jgi:hypothetical protein
MSRAPRAPDGMHYLGVAPVEVDAGGRVHVSRENLRFAPEFGGIAAKEGNGLMGILGNTIGGALDFLAGNPDGDTDSDLADDFGDDEYIDLGYDDFGANNVGVVRAWMEGKYAQSGTMRTDGTNLWSYALLIGTTDGSGGKVAYEHRSSPTTNRHISLARQYAHATLPAPFGGNPDGDTDSDLADDFGKKKKGPKHLKPKDVKRMLGKGLKGKVWSKRGKTFLTFHGALNKKNAAKTAKRKLSKKGIEYTGGITMKLLGVFPAPPPAPFPIPVGIWRAQVDEPGASKGGGKSRGRKGGKGGGGVSKAAREALEPAQGALKSVPGRESNVTPEWAQGWSQEAEDAAVEERYQSAIQKLLADEFGLDYIDLAGNPDGDTDSDLADDFGGKKRRSGGSKASKGGPPKGGRPRRGRRGPGRGRRGPGRGRPQECLDYMASGARDVIRPIRRRWAGANQGMPRERKARMWLGFMANYTPKNKDEADAKTLWLACQQARGRVPASVGGDPYADYLAGCGCGS